MERLKERIATAERAQATLAELIGDTAPSKIVRDAAIQRFEYTSEALWRAAQRYLLVVEGVSVTSPKGIARACGESGLLDDEDTELALEMVDDRNLTVHTYNEELAEAIFGRIPSYAKLSRHWIEAMRQRV